MVLIILVYKMFLTMTKSASEACLQSDGVVDPTASFAGAALA